MLASTVAHSGPCLYFQAMVHWNAQSGQIVLVVGNPPPPPLGMPLQDLTKHLLDLVAINGGASISRILSIVMSLIKDQIAPTGLVFVQSPWPHWVG